MGLHGGEHLVTQFYNNAYFDYSVNLNKTWSQLVFTIKFIILVAIMKETLENPPYVLILQLVK